MEIWKPIPGHPNYEASSEGRIRNVKFSRLLKIGNWGNGYCRVELGMYGGTHLVHRLVMLAFVGADPARPWVNHKNGIRNDNRIENLEWSTAQENILHKTRVLKNSARSRHPRTHLSEDDVMTIRKEIQSGAKRRMLAERYRVSLSTIHAIASHQNWKTAS